MGHATLWQEPIKVGLAHPAQFGGHKYYIVVETFLVCR